MNWIITKRTFVLFVLIIVCLFSFTLTGCVKPPKVDMPINIETNETAFLVPLEGDTESQGKFMSLDYLEQSKVAAKRVLLPQTTIKIGRFDHEIKWVPSMRVIKVDRTPVTREWTQDSDKGTTSKNEAVDVESRDSIGFSVGVNITTMVTEENSAKFLYYYAGKPLAEVTDENVRGFVTSLLSQEFGSRELQKCKSDKKAIQTLLSKKTSEHFDKFGVTVSNIGIVGGLSYEDGEIQSAINDAYTAEMSIKQKDMENRAQAYENSRKLSIAVTERREAQEFDKAYDAMVKKTELEIARMQAEAQLTAAKKWSGTLPSSILPQGSNLLFNLDSSR